MDKISKKREEIDNIDEKILNLLKERRKVALEIGRIKKELGISIKDKKREEELMEKVETRAENLGLNTSDVKKIWEYLIEISYKAER